MTDKPISIGRHKTGLLCPDCDSLEPIQGHSDEMCVLQCGHVRTLGLLPSLPGAISLEDVLNNTPDAARLFPFVIDGVNETEILAEQKEREEWNQ